MVSDIEKDLNSTIKELVEYMCKENKINYKKQEYKLLFSNEKMLFENNNMKFTSGSKSDLSFYGKVYLNKNGKVVESIYLDGNVIEVEPKDTELIIMYGGTKNSTTVEVDQELPYFYVAPVYLLEMQDLKLWQDL
jgi:uncharacterized HAD superfamily protein